MLQEKEGLLFTKTLSDPQNYYTSDEIYPSVPTTNDTNNNSVYSVISTNNKAYMDLIGSFQYFSRQVNEYVLIVYHYNDNVIVGVPLNKSQSVTIKKPWKYLHEQFCSAGLTPKTWILDHMKLSFTNFHDKVQKKLPVGANTYTHGQFFRKSYPYF